MEAIKVNVNIHDLVIKMFQSADFECPEYDEARQKLEEVYTELYQKLMTGSIDCFWMFTDGDESNGQQRIYTRSIKQPGCVQISYIWYRDGEIIPTMDEQAWTAEEMIRKSSPDNVKIFIE